MGRETSEFLENGGILLIDPSLALSASEIERDNETCHIAVLEQLMKTSSVSDGDRPDDATVSRVTAYTDAALRAAPGDAAIHVLEGARQKLWRVRQDPGSIDIERRQPIMATFLCPIHRGDELENAVLQISRPTWRKAEAIFAANCPGIPERMVRERWTPPLPLTVIDCIDCANVGGVLNRGFAASNGTVLFKIDADAVYLPRYATDIILNLEFLNADAISKKAIFQYFRKYDTLDLENPACCYRTPNQSAKSGGSALCFRRDVVEQLPFHENSSISEDFIFVSQCMAVGYRVEFVDPFNHYSVSKADPAHHTWDIDNIILRLAQARILIGRGPAALTQIEE